MFEKAYNLLTIVKKISVVISSVAIALMILLIVFDVFGRTLLGSGINGSYEMVESILMPTAIFWALLVTYSSGSVPRIDLLIEKFPPKIHLAVSILLILIDIFIYGVVAWFSWSRASIALEQGVSISAGGNLISITPMFIFVPLAFLLITIEAIFILIKMIKDKKSYYTIDPTYEPMKE